MSDMTRGSMGSDKDLQDLGSSRLVSLQADALKAAAKATLGAAQGALHMSGK